MQQTNKQAQNHQSKRNYPNNSSQTNMSRQGPQGELFPQNTRHGSSLAQTISQFGANNRIASPGQEVANLMKRVADAANVLAQAANTISANEDTEQITYNKSIQIIEACLDEIDSLLLCKIATTESFIPSEVMQKVVELKSAAEDAFSKLIDTGHLEFIGAGTEGAAHKLRLSVSSGKTREFVVLKKSHLPEDGRIRNEFNMQEAAYISTSGIHGVSVPRPYMNFTKGNDHYMVMEYVPGKTLYTLQLEQVANKIVLEKILRRIAEDSVPEGTKMSVLAELKDMYSSNGDSEQISDSPSSPLYGFFARHIKDSPIRFENDSIAEEKLMQLLQIAYQIGAVNGDPMKKVLDPQFGVEVLELATKLYRENEKLFPLFVEKEAVSAMRSLRAFFDKLHSDGVYHRDFHPRNVIIGYDGNVHVIDFGYAKLNPDNPYAESGGGERIDDMNLVTYIGRQRPGPEHRPTDLLGPKIAKQQILLENFDYTRLFELTGVSPSDIRLKVSVTNYSFPTSFLVSQFKQLVQNKVGPTWEFKLQPKGDQYKGHFSALIRWTLSLAMLDRNDLQVFRNMIQTEISGMSPTAKKRANSLMSRLEPYLELAEALNSR